MAGSSWTNQLLNLIILSAAQKGFSGFFVYSPAPGPGNLIGSWAAAAGVDPYGNAYPAGLSVEAAAGISTYTQGTAPTGTIVTGSIWIDTSAGNSIYIWSGTSWVAYTLGSEAITPGSITASLLSAGIVVAGIVNGTTITGATIIADGTTGQFLAYSGTPAAGNLIASVSGAASTDTFGNNYLEGSASYQSGFANAMIGGALLFYTGTLAGGWSRRLREAMISTRSARAPPPMCAR